MTTRLEFLTDALATPIGELVYVCDREGALRMIDWSDHNPRGERLLNIHYGKGGYALTRQRDPFDLTTRLATYFAGPKIRWLLDNVDGAREAACAVVAGGTAPSRRMLHTLGFGPRLELVSYRLRATSLVA